MCWGCGWLHRLGQAQFPRFAINTSHGLMSCQASARTSNTLQTPGIPRPAQEPGYSLKAS